MLFDFLSMADDYEDRKVARYEKNGVCIDTCAVTDSGQPFETGIQHPAYNDGNWVIVELYDTIEDARKGHKKWVKKLTAQKLPKQLKDVSSATTAKMCFAFDEADRVKPKAAQTNKTACQLAEKRR